MTGFLALEDGTVFRGESVGAEGFAFGEAVFTTAMTGYQEVVTDPSYAEQLVCFTAPMVGNYGVAPAPLASRARPHARAVVMREARGPAWTDWLHERGIVALSGIDTRSLVLHLRDARRDARDRRRRRRARSRRRSRAVARAAVDGRPRARRAASRRASRTSTRDAGDVRGRGRRLRLQALDPRPARGGGRGGDRLPARRRRRRARAATTACCSRTARATRSRSRDEVETVRELLGRVPVLGICLGHQLLALATGHETFKLPFGHRGANHPGARARDRPRARHEPEPRLRGRAVGRRRRRRTSRSTTARSRASTSRRCARARCSSIPRPARARTTPGR